MSVTKVEAITYVTLFSIGREEAQKVLNQYPELQQQFRKHAIRSLFYEELISFKNACIIFADIQKHNKLTKVGITTLKVEPAVEPRLTVHTFQCMKVLETTT